MIRLLSAAFGRVGFNCSFRSSLRVMLLLQYKFVCFCGAPFPRFVMIHLQTVEVSRLRLCEFVKLDEFITNLILHIYNVY